MNATESLNWLSPEKPYSIAHRGASAYAPPNTIEAFRLAAQLGADFWEVDLHITADNQIIAFHDENLRDGRALADLVYLEIKACTEEDEAPLFSSIIRMALDFDIGLYADIKALDAAAPTVRLLIEHGIDKAILGAFDPAILAALNAADTHYPHAALVPLGADPFEHAREADIIHLCWENMSRPQDFLDDAFFDHCHRTGQKVVLWHEEDPVRMAELRIKPVLGICSDRPELVKPFTAHKDWPVKIVCHRGLNRIAPENTLPAAHAAFSAGFSHVEVDVQVTADDALVVMHDLLLERTTSGKGPVSSCTLEKLRELDAGGWFSSHFAGEPVPLLAEFLDLAELYDASLYVELKSAPAAQVWRAVVEHGAEGRCFFWSFSQQALVDLRAIAADASIMVRRQDFKSLDDAMSCLEPGLIEFTFDDDWSEFEALRKSGISVMIAYGGDNPDMMRQIARARPDLVNLDNPLLFATIYSQASSIAN
ncbi:MAG: hypothetical protein HKN42_04220 [Granulosicoccus sp.]|nr:hypothetical protein [Granulosicoccus sp.]